MRDLLAAEFLKWRRRPEVLGTGMAVIAISAVSWLAGFSGAQSAALSGSAPVGVSPAVTDFFLAPYRFPLSIVVILTTGFWLELGVFYLAAATTGGEYLWATVRNVLLRLTRRADYVMARLLFLVIAGSLVVAGLVVVGGVLPFIVGTKFSLAEAPPSSPALAVGFAFGVAWLSVVLYASAGTFLATVLHDRATPLIVGLVVVLLQTLTSPLPFWTSSEILVWVPRLFPSNTVGTLMIEVERQAGLLTPEAVIPSYLAGSWLIACGASIAWIAALVMGTVLVLKRADVVE